eukprot:10838278-Heterocapsa_arctica.AAC.1
MKANASKQRAYYVYVDNLGGIASEASEASSVVYRWTHDFEKVELLLHKYAVLCGDAEALGVHIDGEQLRSGITQKRLHTLRGALEAVLRRGRIACW